MPCLALGWQAGARLHCCIIAPFHPPQRQNSSRYSSTAPVCSSVVFTCVFWPVPAEFSSAYSLSGLIGSNWEAQFCFLAEGRQPASRHLWVGGRKVMQCPSSAAVWHRARSLRVSLNCLALRSSAEVRVSKTLHTAAS